MLADAVKKFAEENDKAVLTTFRGSGAAQMSINQCTPFVGGVAFTTPEDRAKYKNLVRDPRCSLLISQENWWGYVVLEGKARIDTVATLGKQAFLDAWRTVYRQISGDHPNWDE